MPAVVKDEGTVDLDRIRRWHVRGLEQSNFGRPAAANRTLIRALDALAASRPSAESITLRTQILISLAKVESELAGVQVGLDRLNEAARSLDAGPDPVVLAAFHNQRAALLIRAGRYGEAVQCCDEAERHFRHAAPRDRVYALLNRGTARMLSGDLRRASVDVEKGAIEAESAGLSGIPEMALHNLGYLRFLMGNLPGALSAMDDALSRGRQNAGVSLLDRARVLVEAGLVREADDTLAEAARIVRTNRLAQDLGEIEIERARCALIMGDIRSARRLAGSARDRFRRRESDSWRRSAELVLLQGDLAANRPGLRLLEPALRLRDEFDEAGQQLAARTAALLAAEAALRAERVDDVRQLMRSIGRPRSRDPITARLHVRYVRAALEREQGRTALAARHVRSGLSDLAAYQASFGSIDLQTASAVHGRRLAELGLGIALESGRPDAVLVAAETARAVSNRLPVVRPPADPEAARLLTELRQVVESINGSGPGNEAADLVRRRVALEREITARRWTVGGSGDARAVASVDEIEAAVGDGVLVSYVVTSGMLHAVVLSGGMFVTGIGPAAQVFEEIRRLRADLDVLAQPLLVAGLRDAVIASARRSVARLDELLVRPLGVDGRRVVIVPTGVLGQLPWNSVPSLQEVPVAVAPSATVWVGAQSARRRRRQHSVYALGGPGMTHGSREVRGVARAWRSAGAHSAGAADRAALTEALRRGSLVHVAAHGVHQTENPLFSSLRLTDGMSFAYELDDSRRTPEHVVLSACELGLATVRPGDEALGLTSVLLRLGTRCVVSGVARVNDELAAETMIDYHRRLARGADSAEALAQAIAAAPGPTPFVCFGAAWSA
ncbi:MAG TPA: CHAT domain-containing protein [Jatrophihabitantaceae bacterium]|nr:CHAT domain-containing protein [Jatrophihabitantaceae bacterium]